MDHRASFRLAALLGGFLVAGSALTAQTSPGAHPDADDAPAPAPAGRDPGEAEYLKINYVFNRGLWEIAIPRYEKLLADHPDFARKAMVHYALALCHRGVANAPERAGAESGAPRREHLRAAVRHEKLALKTRGFDRKEETLLLLARDLLELGQTGAARKVWTLLVEKASGPARVTATLGLADAAYRTGQSQEAARLYRQGLELATEQGAEVTDQARYGLALSLYRLGGGHLEEAEEIFDRLASTAGAESADSAYMAAQCAQARGASDEALERFERIIAAESSPWREAAHLGKATALLALGQSEEALAAVDAQLAAYPTGPRSARAKLLRARCLASSGKLRDGARLLNELRGSPEVATDASLYLARLYSERGHHEPAVTILEAALASKVEPERREELELELSIELVSAGLFADAGKALSAYLESYPESPSRDQVLYLRAYALHHSGEREASLAECRKLLDSGRAGRFERECRQLLAENLFLLDRPREAEKAYEEYLSRFGEKLSGSERIVARFRLAQCASSAGDWPQAISRLDALIDEAGEEEIDRVAARRPALAEWRYLLGEAAYQAGDNERAARELGRYLATTDEPRHGPDARYRRAHALLLAGRREESTEAFRKAVAADPGGPFRARCWFEIGQAALDAGEAEDAEKAFRKVVEDESPPAEELRPRTLGFLGWIARQAGRAEDAIGWYGRLVEKYPSDERHAESLWLLALSLRDASRFEEARKTLARLRREHPDDGTILEVELEEAVTLAREGKNGEARTRLQELAHRPLPPPLAVLRDYELAWCHRREREWAAAITAYERVLESAKEGVDLGPRAPLVPTARLELAELEFEREKYARARELLAPLLDDRSGAEDSSLRERALYRLCWCHYREENAEALEKTTDRYRREFPGKRHATEISLLVARLRIDRHEFAAAERLFRQVREASPEGDAAELATVGLAECLNEQRRYEDALGALRPFVAKHSESRHAARAHFGLGWALEHLQRFEPAIASYRRVEAPGTEIGARAQYQIGQCLAARKKYDEAVVEYLQVPARFAFEAWSCRATLQIAGCFEALEEPARARDYYRRVLKDWPDRDEAKLARQRLDRLP